MKRALLVQTCHIPQLAYVLEQVRKRHPGTILELLLMDHPQVRSYLHLFEGCQVHFFHSGSSLPEAASDQIIVPLLNRGYGKIKKRLLSEPVKLLETDYTGGLTPLSRARLIRSILFPQHSPPPEFAQYLSRFPHRPLGEKILQIESAHPLLVQSTRAGWSRLIPEQAEVIRLQEAPLRSWLKLWGKDFDSAVVFFSGEQGYWTMRLLPFFLRIPKTLIVNENGHYFYASFRSLTRFLIQRIIHGPRLTTWSPRILFIQTEAPAIVRASLQALRAEKLYPAAEILLVCREEDRHEFEGLSARLLTYSRRKRGGLRLLLREILSFEPDLAVANFTGRPVFRKQKLLFLLPFIRRRLVFNAQVDCYPLSIRTFPRLFRKDLIELEQPRQRALYIYTRGVKRNQAVHLLESLARPEIANATEINILCPARAAAIFSGIPEAGTVHIWRPARLWSNLRTLRRLLRRRPNLVSAKISWRSLFRLPDLLFFLLPIRNRLAFNVNLDCQYVQVRNLLSLLRARPAGTGVLLIQTEEEQHMMRAVATLRQPHVAAGEPILVLCREDNQIRFEQAAGVAEVITYPRNASLGQAWRLFRELCSRRLSVAAAVFSGRPIYRPGKLLFFLLPVKGRLVFNANLDCFYLTRKTLPQLLNPSRLRNRLPGFPILQPFLKAFLFFPRFFFLVIWITNQKLRRVYLGTRR